MDTSNTQVQQAPAEVRTLTIKGHDGKDVQVLAVPNGYSVEGIGRYVDPYRGGPEQRTGTARLKDLSSFVEHTARFKDPDSVIFANVDYWSLTTVFDYHRAGSAGEARFCRHRNTFTFDRSHEWDVWSAGRATSMNQEQFESFIQKRFGDLVAPDLASADVKERCSRLDIALATPAQLLAVSRSVTVQSTKKVGKVRKSGTTEVERMSTSHHVDDAGAPLPRAFVFRVPPFAGCEKIELIAQLEVNDEDGAIAIEYRVDMSDRILDGPFNAECKALGAVTGLPVFLGSAE